MLQALYNSVVERAKPIEAVNVDGGRFIREAKVRLMFRLLSLLCSNVLLYVCVSKILPARFRVSHGMEQLLLSSSIVYYYEDVNLNSTGNVQWLL